jgi:CPA2 family monovalent cation:H+ antiporter-2
LAQIGEFSFILATLGVALKILTLEAQNLILAGALVSISLNAALFSLIEPAQVWIRKRSDLARLLERNADPLAMLPDEVDHQYLTGQVVLVGYGEVGARVAQGFTQQGIRFVVADENRETVELLREQGIPAVSGDASDPAVLIQAHIMRASTLVVATTDFLDVRRMAEIAQTLNPAIQILLCAETAEEAALLEQENIGTVFFTKQVLADQMTQHIVQLNASQQVAATTH